MSATAEYDIRGQVDKRTAFEMRHLLYWYMLLGVSFLLTACGESAQQPASAPAQQSDLSTESTSLAEPTESSTTNAATCKQEPTIESGLWQGEYIDANGYRGDLRLTLVTSGDTLTGEIALKLRTEDQAQVIRGTVDGVAEYELVHLRSALEGVPEKIEYAAEVRPAGSYACHALFGTMPAVPQYNLGGGIWIAWRFEDY